MAQLRFIKDGKAHTINFKYVQLQDEHGLMSKLMELPTGYVLTLATGDKETANDRVLEFVMNPASIKKSLFGDRYGYDSFRKSYDPNPAKVETTAVVILTALTTFGLLCLSALF